MNIDVMLIEETFNNAGNISIEFLEIKTSEKY